VSQYASFVEPIKKALEFARSVFSNPNVVFSEGWYTIGRTLMVSGKQAEN